MIVTWVLDPFEEERTYRTMFRIVYYTVAPGLLSLEHGYDSLFESFNTAAHEDCSKALQERRRPEMYLLGSRVLWLWQCYMIFYYRHRGDSGGGGG